MRAGTTRWPDPPVADGEADAEVVPVSLVEVVGTTETEVSKEGEPVAVRIPVSEVGRVEATRVLLPTIIGTTGTMLLAVTEVTD